MQYNSKKYVNLAGINEINYYLQMKSQNIQDQAKQSFLP